MNNTDIAEKYGIKECLFEFFSEECLKFYSKNDIEIIENDTIPLLNLQLSGYDYDEDSKYYTKTNNTFLYDFNGKKYELFEYKDCFVYYVFICNTKLKKFRHIEIEDIVEFAKENIEQVYIYKNKYYCQYYKAFKSLIFFNRNEYIRKPAFPVIEELKKAEAPEFYSKYFDVKDGKFNVKSNIEEFYIADDEAILVKFSLIYDEIMREMFRIDNPTYYKDVIQKQETDIDNMKNLDDMNKGALKMHFLYANDKFRNFCNNICEPAIFKKELLKNGEVRKNLKNNFWIYHEFESSLRNTSTDFIDGEDFTFLILNAIKSLEYLLYRKIKNYKDFNVNENSDEISEKLMFNALISYIMNHKEMFKFPNDNVISKVKYDSIIKSYIELLFYVKDECRNGYFHKHRIDTYDALREKREKVLEAIAKTIIFLK